MTAYPQLLLENQLCFPLYAAARLVTGSYTPYLKPLGLTYTQYVVMMVLWEQQQVTMGELGRRLHLDNGTLTPLMKRLEADGLIFRSRSKADERVVQISLTAKGQSLQAQAAEIPARVAGCVKLTPEEGAALYTLLGKVISGYTEE